MRAFLLEQRGEEGLENYDIVVEGNTPGNDPEAAAQVLHPWQSAGATWWIEANWQAESDEQIVERIRQGPPNRGLAK